MKILVTVGTTRFDGLIEHLDTHASDIDGQFTMQIADGSYCPVNIPWFRFSENIDPYYRDADLVITHGGAGSVYRLLELGKPIIVVPNLERNDNHQEDLANYMARRNHALVVRDFELLMDTIRRCPEHQFEPYSVEPFSAADEILSFVLEN